MRHLVLGLCLLAVSCAGGGPNSPLSPSSTNALAPQTQAPEPGVLSITEIATITGGTGRFAGATGSFTIERVLTDATGVSSGSFNGTISWAH
jgi:hypothetical protein